MISLLEIWEHLQDVPETSVYLWGNAATEESRFQRWRDIKDPASCKAGFGTRRIHLQDVVSIMTKRLELLWA